MQLPLQALSQALLPVEIGTLDGYHSIIANFQLDPKYGEDALQKWYSIQTFLDCVLTNVNQSDNDNSNDNKNGQDELTEDDKHGQE